MTYNLKRILNSIAKHSHNQLLFNQSYLANNFHYEASFSENTKMELCFSELLIPLNYNVRSVKSAYSLNSLLILATVLAETSQNFAVRRIDVPRLSSLMTLAYCSSFCSLVFTLPALLPN